MVARFSFFTAAWTATLRSVGGGDTASLEPDAGDDARGTVSPVDDRSGSSATMSTAVPPSVTGTSGEPASSTGAAAASWGRPDGKGGRRLRRNRRGHRLRGHLAGVRPARRHRRRRGGGQSPSRGAVRPGRRRAGGGFSVSMTLTTRTRPSRARRPDERVAGGVGEPGLAAEGARIAPEQRGPGSGSGSRGDRPGTAGICAVGVVSTAASVRVRRAGARKISARSYGRGGLARRRPARTACRRRCRRRRFRLRRLVHRLRR